MYKPYLPARSDQATSDTLYPPNLATDKDTWLLQGGSFWQLELHHMEWSPSGHNKFFITRGYLLETIRKGLPSA